MDMDLNQEYAAMTRKLIEQKKAEVLVKKAEFDRVRGELNDLRVTLERLMAVLEIVDGDSFENAGSVGSESCLLGKGASGEELRGDRLRDEIVTLLRENHPDPLHYRDIVRMIFAKGFTIPGTDPGVNVLAHISREPRIGKGERRGTYVLAEADTDQVDCGGGA